MATETGPAGATFSSPTMRARVHLLLGLAAVDELERAWARRDYWRAREFVRTAQAQLAAARVDFEESWSQTDSLEAVEPAAVDPAWPAHGPSCGWDGRDGSCQTPAYCQGLGEAIERGEAYYPETETEARMAWGDR